MTAALDVDEAGIFVFLWLSFRIACQGGYANFMVLIEAPQAWLKPIRIGTMKLMLAAHETNQHKDGGYNRGEQPSSHQGLHLEIRRNF